MGLLDNMPHTCAARRRLRTSDGMGGYVDSFDEVLFSGRACWRQQAGDSEVTWWQQRGEVVTDKVYFTSDPGLDPGCVLDFGTERYDVVSLPKPDASAGLGVVWRAMVRYIGETT